MLQTEIHVTGKFVKIYFSSFNHFVYFSPLGLADFNCFCLITIYNIEISLPHSMVLDIL